jgi:hypothetical protein
VVDDKGRTVTYIVMARTPYKILNMKKVLLKTMYLITQILIFVDSILIKTLELPVLMEEEGNSQTGERRKEDEHFANI